MKKILITVLLILSCGMFFAQSSNEIANVYIKKASKNLESLEVDNAFKNFNKAMKLFDTVTTPNVARLGTLINFELENYAEAKRYIKQYFALIKKKKTEEYAQLLDLYVTIEEEIEKKELAEKKLELERLKREKEKQRIDSLTSVWQQKSDAMSLKITSIAPFNKNNVALFKKGEFMGIVDDSGTVLVDATDYRAAKAFDGFILLMDQKKEPTQIFCYNTKTKTGFLLPSVSEFNTLSTHYGKVMLPRGNGHIVTYPNNSFKTYVYNAISKKFINVNDEKAVFKDLKKAKRISKYNKEGQVKIAKEWYNFGGHIGGGIYPLYLTDYKLYGFLCGLDGKVLTASVYRNLGAFYKNKINVLDEVDSFWINQNGTKVSAPENEAGTYVGASKVVQLENGSFQIHQKIEGKDVIVLGNEKLEILEDFLRKNP